MSVVGRVTCSDLGNGVAQILLDNPPLNLITVDMALFLERALIQAADDPSVRVVVISGAGERAFSAGSDIKEFPPIMDDFVGKKLRRESAVYSRIETIPKPVIAAVNASALGGGCELSLACDFRIIDENAKIGLPEINIGAFPGSGGMSRLPKLIGTSRAMEMLCFGSVLSAQEALQIGLVHRVAPAGKAMDAAYDMACVLSRKAMFSLRCIKEAVLAAPLQSAAESAEMCMRLTETAFKTADCLEGIRAFLGKYKPKFEGAPE